MMNLRKLGIPSPLLLAVSTLVGAACIHLDDDHCIVNGGDFACSEARICVANIESIVEMSDRGDGCVLRHAKDAADFRDYFVHVQYGLPSQLGARTQDDIDSVTGVLVRTTEERRVECGLGERVVRMFEPQWIEVREIRDELESAQHVSVSEASLSNDQAEAIERFNDAINIWLLECGS